MKLKKLLLLICFVNVFISNASLCAGDVVDTVNNISTNSLGTTAELNDVIEWRYTTINGVEYKRR